MAHPQNCIGVPQLTLFRFAPFSCRVRQEAVLVEDIRYFHDTYPLFSRHISACTSTHSSICTVLTFGRGRISWPFQADTFAHEIMSCGLYSLLHASCIHLDSFATSVQGNIHVSISNEMS